MKESEELEIPCLNCRTELIKLEIENADSSIYYKITCPVCNETREGEVGTRRVRPEDFKK